MTEPLTVAVLGAGGTIGPAIVRDLAESEEVAALRLLDVDGARAAAVAGAHGLGKAEARAVDATAPDALAAALDGCAVVVNAASYRVNLEVMRASLAARCHYIDLGGLYWMTRRQLALHDRFQDAGLLALLGMGSSPGKTNVMAVQAARELGRAEELHVSAAGRDLAPPAGFSVPYALRTLIDELTLRPVVVRGGSLVEIDPLTPGGTVGFPDPIGEAGTIYTLHSELATFPDSFGVSEASFRLSLAPALLERLRALAAGPPEAVQESQAAALPPSSRTVSAHIVEARANGRLLRVSALTGPATAWRMGGGVVSTAAPAAAAVRLIARGRITAQGVLPPERCVDPGDLFPELERRGCTFHVETREAVSR